MKLLALFVLFAVAASKYVLFDPDLDEHWKNFKKVFGKSYEGREEVARRVIWEQRVADIFQHNLEADLGFHSFRRGLNEFSDVEHREFVSQFNGFRLPEQSSKSNASAWLRPNNIQLPQKVDWRDEGLVTEVKNQLHCGSCWSFSATGSLEGQHKRQSGQLVSLSEQNLVDCSRPQGNKGCNGGVIDFAFEYIKSNGGIDTEESYAYLGKDDSPCTFKTSAVGATCTGYVNLPVGDEGALQEAVASVGPVSVAIDASHEGFHSYRSGVYNEPDCSSEKLDHGVLLIGYGTENGLDYWLVKNSWGTTWGDNGYIKMSRNKNNQCGIATHALYPLV